MNEPLTLEQYQELLALGGQNADLDQQMKMQLAQAKMMREGGAPQMREVGRVTVAPHWLELVGGLAKQKVAGDIDKQAMMTGQTRQANVNKQNEMIMRGILGGTPQASTAQGPGLRLPKPRSPFSFGGDY